MKFLKLRLDDLELYNVEGTDEKSTFLYSNMPAFRRLYSEQGETFWIRHLVTFREYFYILIRAKFLHEEGQCLHWIINPMEKTFIRIHKLLFAGGFESAKENLKIIKKHVFKLDAICPLITNSQCRLIASSSVKSAYKALFGSHLGRDKIAIIKAFLASGLYKHFCGSLGVLLKRCEVAIDVPSMFDDDCPKMQYWAPFAIWGNNYQSDLFENYIAHYYGDRLPKILMTPNLHHIFQSKFLHHCCEKFIKDYSCRLVDESEKYQRTEYMRCEHHAFCYVRIVHSDSCKNPYMSCLRKGRCSFRCDTECIRKSAENKPGKDYWKPHCVTIYPGIRGNFRDVQTSAETEKAYRTVETYIYRTVDYGSDWNDGDQAPFWRSLPPDLVNIAKQIKRKEKTKSRLRDKLSKKAKEMKKDDHLHFLQMEELKHWETFEFRSILYCKAQRKFREELGDDLLCRMLTGKVGNTDDPLLDLFEEKLEMEYLLPRLNGNVVTKKKKFRSIGVGSDVSLDIKFLPYLKKSHIKERLAKQNSRTDSKLSPEIIEEQKMTYNVCNALATDVQMQSVAEGNKIVDASKNINKNNVEIDLIPKAIEASTKEKNGPKNSKKNGKKNQKTNNEKLHSKETQTSDTGEWQDNEFLYETLEVFNPYEMMKPDLKHTNEKKRIVPNHADIISEVLHDDELGTSAIDLSNALSHQQESEVVGKIENGELPIELKPPSAIENVENNIDHDVIKKTTLDNKLKKDNSENKTKKDNPENKPKDNPENKSKEDNPENKSKEDNPENKSKEDNPENKPKDNPENKLKDNSEIKSKKDNLENKTKSTKLRICGYCEKQEPTRRTFKKCKLCKEAGSNQARYYCSKDCQVGDWKKRHEADHQRT